MKCEKHPNNDAVAQCTECGTGICKECAENTKELREYHGTLCIDCYTDHIKHALYNTNEDLKKIKRKIKGKLIFYLIGLICVAIGGIMLLTNNAENAEAFIVFGVFFCGIYMGIAGWKTASEGYAEQEEKYGATYTVTSDGSVYRDQGWGIKIIFFLISLAFGIIATPISLLADSQKKRNFENSISVLENELERIYSL